MPGAPRGCPPDARIDDGDVDVIQADVLETPLVDRVTAESGDEVGEVGFAYDCELLLQLLGIRVLVLGQGVEGCALFGGESGVCRHPQTLCKDACLSL
ncbi:hypothetical protein ACGFZQ_39190 [Streptomyces sp. NPDC048254]|uniref:hypothetical protein n=1 Tax=Streptomyces sp. NPDC048254 TaxID=3365525 RepID=UPI00371311CF